MSQAPVGQRSAHRPQCTQTSSSLTMTRAVCFSGAEMYSGWVTLRAGAFSRRSVLRRCFRRAIFARTRAGEQLDCSGCIVNSLLTETVDDHSFNAFLIEESDVERDRLISRTACS